MYRYTNVVCIIDTYTYLEIRIHVRVCIYICVYMYTCTYLHYTHKCVHLHLSLNVQPIADGVAQHLEIISKNFRFSTRRTKILFFPFITWY